MNDFQLQVVAANICKSEDDIREIKIKLINDGISVDDIDNFSTIVNQLLTINEYERKFNMQITSPEDEKKLTLLKDEETILTSKYSTDEEMTKKINTYIYLSNLRTINHFGILTSNYTSKNPHFKDLFHELELSKRISTEIDRYSDEDKTKIKDFYSKINNIEQQKTK